MRATQTTSALLNRLLARGKFRHVQVVLLLAEYGSIQRAAEAIGLTQSSVTQTLAYLERLLEVQLFERYARGVRPTPACTDLLPVARQLLLGVATSADLIVARQRDGEGVVRLIASAAALYSVLLDELPAFCDRFPGIQVGLSEAEGEDQLLAISRDEVDLVVCRRPSAIPKGWEFHALLEDRFVVVGSAAHRLVGTRRPSAENLANETWLLPPADVAGRRIFDEFSSHFPRQPRRHGIVTRSIAMTWRLLRQGDLLALIPFNLARPLIDRGELAEVRLAKPLTIEPIGVLQPQSGRGQATEHLIDHLRGRAKGRHPTTAARDAPARSRTRH